jgi:tripartite-type tricarboxylate transporter receptor subunit TctC
LDRRAFVKGATAIALGVPAYRALAQSFPSRNIRIVVPAGAGSPPDILARIVGNAIAESESWTVVVENKPGGVQTIGTAEVLRQPADGHTLLSVTTPIAASTALVSSVQWKIERDFAPVVQVGTSYNILVVNPSTPVNSLPEFVAISSKVPASIRFPREGSAHPPICSANCSSWKLACRRPMFPTRVLHEQSRT